VFGKCLVIFDYLIFDLLQLFIRVTIYGVLILKSTAGYTIELDSSVSDTEIEDYKEKLKEFCPESNDYCNITSNGKTITLDAKYSDEFLKDEIFKKSPEDFKNFMETVNENVTCTISK